MSIDKKTPALLPIGTHAAAGDLTMAAVIQKWGFSRPVDVRRIMVAVKTAPTVTATVVTFKRYPTFDSSSGAVTVGTITIPVATAAGKNVYKDIAAVRLKPGEMLVAEVTTTSSAGAGCALVECEDSPEDARNNTNMLASA